MVKTLLLAPVIDKGNNENKTTTTPTTKQTKRHNSKTNVPSFCGRCFTFLVLFLFSLWGGGGGVVLAFNNLSPHRHGFVRGKSWLSNLLETVHEIKFNHFSNTMTILVNFLNKLKGPYAAEGKFQARWVYSQQLTNLISTYEAKIMDILWNYTKLFFLMKFSLLF